MGKLIVGLMSGTSVDAVDAALVKIDGAGTATKVKLIHYLSTKIPRKMKNKIFQAMDLDKSNVRLICSLNYELGFLFSEAVKHLCADASVSLSQIDLIGSHGQTIYHIPHGNANVTASSLQIGEPAIIAYETNGIVVSNFRAMDIAAGGVGAPLVPYTEYLLYRSKKENIILQNVGGIGNATFIPVNAKLQDISAFDTGPGNMIIDELCRRFYETNYDAHGEHAARGKVASAVVQKWLKIPFFKKKPPKATGRELFGAQFVDKWLADFPKLSPDDWIATATYFTARTIADAYKKFIFPKAEIHKIVIGGGGSYNRTLLQMLQQLLPGCSILTQEDLGYSSDAKEAIAFAVLANECINSNPSNLPSATGADHPVILGQITYPPNSK